MDESKQVGKVTVDTGQRRLSVYPDATFTVRTNGRLVVRRNSVVVAAFPDGQWKRVEVSA